MKIEISNEEAVELERLLENAARPVLAVKVRDQIERQMQELEELTRTIEQQDKPRPVREIEARTARRIWGGK